MASTDELEPSPQEVFFGAVTQGNLTLALSQLPRGADVSLSDPAGNTALHIAAGCGHEDILSSLAAISPGNEKSQNSAGNPCDSCDDTGDNQSDQAGGQSPLEVRNHKGETVLHRAALKGKMGCVEWLLSAGADPSSVDSMGNTPARIARDPEVAAALQNAEMAKAMGMSIDSDDQESDDES